MPNWCYTSYVIDGKRKEVQSLFSKMNNLENRKKPLVGNTFGKRWLGCLVTKLGGDWQKVYCRGSWSDLDWNGSILRFNTETAWGPMTEVFKFIKSIYWKIEGEVEIPLALIVKLSLLASKVSELSRENIILSCSLYHNCL